MAARRLALTAALGLLAAQAGVLGLALFLPRAAPAYRAVYLDHARDCWLADPARRADVGSGDVIRPRMLAAADACALLPKGWNPPDAWGVWSNGAVARLAVPLRPGDTQVVLRLRGYAPGRAQEIKWSVPGQPAAGATIAPGETLALAVPVARDAAANGVLDLTLRIAHVHAPLDADVADWRAIGLALLDVTRRGQGRM